MADEAKDTEVLAKATRRRFPAEERRRILTAAAACTKRGELGAVLRREGIYSSHLSSWRAAAAQRELAALAPKKRGPVAKQVDPRNLRVAELERANARLTKRLERAELIIGVQKKVSEILGISLPDSDEIR
jgi:transposase-like protein